MKLVDVARAAVPGEEVVAAGIFQPGGSLTAQMSGFGKFSLRHRVQEERQASGLRFKRYLMLVVTPTRLHVFDARSEMTRWKAGELLAAWDRPAIRAWTDTKSVTTRLTLEIPSQNRRLELEAPRARRSSAGEVARLLANQPGPNSSHVTQSVRSPFPRLEPEATTRLREQEQWAGIAAFMGGLIRLLAYTLPWIVVSSSFSGTSLKLSGYRELGGPLFSVGFSIVIGVAAIFYLLGRREASPRLLASLGMGSVIAFVFQYTDTMRHVGQLRDALHAQGIAAQASVAFGVWIELAGVILTVAGGLYAYKLWKRTRSPRGPYVPHRPDVTATSAMGTTDSPMDR